MITEQQQQQLKKWYQGLPKLVKQDRLKAWKALHRKPITGYEDLPDEKKNPWEYGPESFAKQTAVDAGCTAEDRNSPATVRNKLIAWAQDGSDAQQMVQRVFDASMSIMILRETLGEQPDETQTEDGGTKPIYGRSKAEEIGLSEDIILREVEDAIRS